jgi:hypothetical protein
MFIWELRRCILNAEAKSRLGNDSDARVVLKNLLTIRNVDGAYLDAMSELHCKRNLLTN